ncbi:hypothetical protein JT06_19300 [Desulfobulbus sp. Tol-SR]|nr:hypothetical protein JT06_19300 [Desulfobulbus sp. Tol-SR]
MKKPVSNPSIVAAPLDILTTALFKHRIRILGYDNPPGHVQHPLPEFSAAQLAHIFGKSFSS